MCELSITRNKTKNIKRHEKIKKKNNCNKENKKNTMFHDIIDML